MKNNQIATFGGGCFWCIEAIFQRIKGVVTITSGYAAGQTINPTYKEVCGGYTGHAEVVQIEFDPNIISYQDLITIFMTSHDPTTLNQQGADKGTQYRSIVLYHDLSQKQTALQVIDEVAKQYEQPIVTELKPADIFYPAEKRHQNYFNRNGYAPYCRIVIQPKINKLRAQYAHFLIDTEEK